MASDTTGRLFTELEHMDEREAQIHAALLRRLEALEQVELRSRSVTVGDLDALRTALDDLRAKVATAPPSVANGASATAPTFEQLEARIREHDAAAKHVRGLLAERLHAHAAVHGGGDAGGGQHAPVAAEARTFKLQRPPMQGADVRAFQRLLNRRFAAWGIARRIAESGIYGQSTRDAAAQVALCLGLLSTDYEHGITPKLRVLIRTPSRRTARQVQRAHERRGYRDRLRAQYAARHAASAAHPAASSNAGGSGSAPGGAIAAAIRAHGGRYENDIVRAAKRFRVPVSLVCAVIDVESSFRNVFGHDTVRNPIKSPGGGILAVTEQRYRAYLRHRRLGEGAQGVGPMQLTHPSLQDEADALGGCFRPAVNIHVGVRHLAALIAEHGLKPGVQRYNGAKGDDYSTEVLRRRHTWDGRLRGAHGPAHGPAHRPAHRPAGTGAPAHAPGHPAPRTFKLMRTPMRGADVRRLQRDLNARFAAWGIGRRIAEDGRYGAQTQLAAHQVAIALGIATAAYEHGITPALRGLIRTPSRRTPRELRRAKARRGYRAKLRKRYDRAGVTAIRVGSLVYPLAVHGRDLGGVAAHKARPFGNWQSDNAVDIAVPRGTAVLAVADGTITRLGGAWHGGSGNPDGFNVTLDAGARRWFYTHLMERVDLSVGQRVSAGQLLGRSGAGNGVDHLHIASSAGDPERLLRV